MNFEVASSSSMHRLLSAHIERWRRAFQATTQALINEIGGADRNLAERLQPTLSALAR
jgi:hypothetical protein